jgi:hypothetical protein
MRQFEIEGLWWSPDQPENAWTGRLSYHQRDGITLTTIEPLNPVSSFSFGGGGKDESYEVLHGRATDGKAVSLLRCYETSSQMTVAGAGPSRRRTLGANSVVIGMHARSADFLVSSASVSVRHLSEWWRRSRLEMDPTVSPPDLAVKYTAPPPLLLCDDGQYRVSLRSGVSGRVGSGKATLDESLTFEIEAAVPKPLSELQRRVRQCTDFLSIACLALCEIDELEVEQPETGSEPQQRGTFHAVPLYRSREKASIVHMMFSGNEAEKRLPELFAAWWSRAESLFHVRALYFAGAYGGGFIEAKLQSLTQALEAFHRRFRDGTYMDEAAFQRDILAPIVAAIPKDTDARLRQSIIARLRYANGFSQRQRFKVLFREYSAGLETLVTKPVEYVDPIVDHRNEFTHFDPEQRTPAVEVPPERVLIYNFLLRMILEACFLESMGFTKDEIVALLRRSETYRQYSVRFRPWALETAKPGTEQADATEAPGSAEFTQSTAASGETTPAGLT